MAALGLGHPPQDLGLAVGHPLRDQLVDGAGHDLAAPGLEQALADLGESLVIVGATTTEATRPAALALPVVSLVSSTGRSSLLVRGRRDRLRSRRMLAAARTPRSDDDALGTVKLTAGGAPARQASRRSHVHRTRAGPDRRRPGAPDRERPRTGPDLPPRGAAERRRPHRSEGRSRQLRRRAGGVARRRLPHDPPGAAVRRAVQGDAAPAEADHHLGRRRLRRRRHADPAGAQALPHGRDVLRDHRPDDRARVPQRRPDPRARRGRDGRRRPHRASRRPAAADADRASHGDGRVAPRARSRARPSRVLLRLSVRRLQRRGRRGGQGRGLLDGVHDRRRRRPRSTSASADDAAAPRRSGGDAERRCSVLGGACAYGRAARAIADRVPRRPRRSRPGR